MGKIKSIVSVTTSIVVIALVLFYLQSFFSQWNNLHGKWQYLFDYEPWVISLFLFLHSILSPGLMLAVLAVIILKNRNSKYSYILGLGSLLYFPVHIVLSYLTVGIFPIFLIYQGLIITCVIVLGGKIRKWPLTSHSCGTV